MLSLERNDGLWPNFVCFLIVTIKSLLEFGDLDLNFQGHNTVKALYNVTRYNRIFNIQHKISGKGSVSIKIPSL